MVQEFLPQTFPTCNYCCFTLDECAFDSFVYYSLKSYNCILLLIGSNILCQLTKASCHLANKSTSTTSLESV